MPRITVTATIPAGQSLSNSIDMSSGTAVFCHMPAAWTPALLTFQVSHDNILFGDLVDERAREVSLNIFPGTVMRVGLWIPAEVGWLKFRSGSRNGAVIQTAARTFTITAHT
jgi:hypothetical protein